MSIANEEQNVDPTLSNTDNHDISNLDGIASDLAGSMPEVQQHVIENEQQKAEAKAAELASAVDNKGVRFDPKIHKSRDGTPTTTTLGNFIKKPKPKNIEGGSGSVISNSKMKQSASVSEGPDVQANVSARASGTMTANLLITMGIVIGGEEWHPLKDEKTGADEKLMLETAFADYFEATGKTDIPPGMALCVAIGGYALPRFTMPKTQSRLSKVKGWFVKKLADRKLKKHGLHVAKTDNQA